MSYDIKGFQKRYALSNKEIASICKCSLPTIQKWRSGEVGVSGAAGQLLHMLDLSAEGNATQLREVLGRLDQKAIQVQQARSSELDDLESSMTQVVDRLELMLESRRKEKELAESEARYLSMLHSHSSPVCRWLPDTTLTYVNEAYAALFRQYGDNLVGQKWLHFIEKPRRSSLAAIVSDMVRRGEEEETIHEVRDANGATRYFEWRDVPVKSKRGDLLEFHTIAHEVTELMQLRKQVEAFQASKNALLELSDQPVMVFDDSGQFIETNDVFRTEIQRGEDWHNLTDFMPGKALGKLNRLLKRLMAKEEVCFQVLVGSSVYLMKTRLLVRDGEASRFLVVFERLNREEDNAVRRVRLQHEVILEGERHEFLMDKAVARGVEGAMEELGRRVNGDRIYVFTFDEGQHVFDNLLEWCADGIPPHIDDLQRIPMSEYPWWVNRLQKEQWIIVDDTSKLPRSAYREREILMAQGIRSILVAPLVVEGTVVGFVGVDHNRSTRIWHDQEKQELESFKVSMERILQEVLRSGA